MALNYSHRPVYAAHTSEDDFVTPMRMVNGCLVEGITEKRGEGYSSPWHVNRGEAEWNFNYGKDKIERRNSPKLTTGDIVDQLPSDPFGMDMKTTFTAITGWLEDLEVDYGAYMTRNSGTSSHGDYDIFAGWNFIWSNALEFQQFPSNSQYNVEKLNPDAASKVNLYKEDRDVMGGALAPYTMGFDSGSTSCSSELQFRGKAEGAANFEGAPHEAFGFALGYLGVKDLLSVERVCRSLCSTVRSDPLLWTSIHIDRPLNDKITDDVLVQLASRAQGNLQCLSLVESSKVTDDGLKRILETNSRLTKLSVSGSARIGMESMVNNIKMYHSKEDVRGIKKVRVAALNGATNERYEELRLLLGVGGQHKLGSSNTHEPHIYHGTPSYLPIDDDCAIDIEMCPRCEVLRLVYDCPAEGCRAKNKPDEICRACIICIPRCTRCGRCLNDTEFVETFCLESVCLDCFNQVGPTTNMVSVKMVET